MFINSDRVADGETIMRGAAGVDTEEIQPQYQDPLDDVFGSAPGSPTHDNDLSEQQRVGAELSDVPRLRSVHVTNGYREGISIGKETSIQAGFDEGYALGAEYGHLAAWIEGVLQTLHSGAKDRQAQLATAISEAGTELSLESLFGPDYFDSDGIWKYEVPGATEETTFRVVAAAHPLLSKWRRTAIEEAVKAGLEIELCHERQG